MGLRDKKRNQRRVLLRRSADSKTSQEEKEQRIREKKQPEEPENTAPVLYIGHIPHGFYEDQMQGFFQQLGSVKKRVRIARNHKESVSIMDPLSLRTLRLRQSHRRKFMPNFNHCNYASYSIYFPFLITET